MIGGSGRDTSLFSRVGIPLCDPIRALASHREGQSSVGFLWQYDLSRGDELLYHHYVPRL